jgi:hypothetical protein
MYRSNFALHLRAAIPIALLAILAFPPDPPRAQDQQNKPPPAPPADQAPLKVATNLVIVRVVVRDPQGNPVEGLRKEDFKIFDRGQAQTITQFEVKSASAPPANPASEHASGEAAPPQPLRNPLRPPRPENL